MDASLPEFLLLFVIGLLVLGPERMSQVAKKIGHFVGYARRMSRNFQVQLEDELEMKQIRDSLPTRVDLRKELGLDEIENDVRKIGEEVTKKPGVAAVPDKAAGLPSIPSTDKNKPEAPLADANAPATASSPAAEAAPQASSSAAQDASGGNTDENADPEAGTGAQQANRGS